jgi:hypothetical protein
MYNQQCLMGKYINRNLQQEIQAGGTLIIETGAEFIMGNYEPMDFK